MNPTIDITVIPRVVLSAAAGVVQSVERAVLGPAHVRTACGNAWEAVLADRLRAERRAQFTVGSSPRSSASHTS